MQQDLFSGMQEGGCQRAMRGWSRTLVPCVSSVNTC